ncbi:MAG: C69 family dipeptidase [Bacteroidales bacterium]|nr:C69 family dipeptidase [Bacteroidales bacterium]MDD3011399.1 C69 family dipeptidase [Bacteroidales bacterium]MDY0285739.1 C69 family dipeptidase [Bacteroidales bacterium]
MIKFSLVMLFVAATIQLAGQENGFNCFTVVAGKAATSDGSVLVAHNEDDYGLQLVNFYRVPPKPAGTITYTKNNAPVSRTEDSWSYLWLEMPGMDFSDCFLNAKGVLVVSNQCTSREDDPKLSEGGITYLLRSQVAAYARNARHGVKIATALLERFGYNSPGRTYTIADSEEAWILAVVNGKHYAAARVPDDKVAVIPNYYTLTSINTADTLNYIISPDLISYAQQRGWYNPETGAEFNFRESYGSPESLIHPVNTGRMWRGVSVLSGETFDLTDAFPTFFQPEKLISLQTLMHLLRDHYEGTEKATSTAGSPHAQEGTICASHTQYGLVAQLRSNLPVEIGSVLWVAMRRPCTQAFIPWYAGITAIPNGFNKYDYLWAEKNHSHPEEGTWDRIPVHAGFTFADFADFVDENYTFRQNEALRKALKTESKFIKNQNKTEKKLLHLYKKNKSKFYTEINWITAKGTAKTINNSLIK